MPDAIKQQIADILRRFHRSSCHDPEAMEGRIFTAIDEIVRALEKARHA